jgi:sensor histidine kinase regulating citrate/malate metabolism
LFYYRRKPAGTPRRILLLVSFPAAYLAFMLIPLSTNGNVIFWAGIIILFALLSGGDSLFTAIYYIGMEACLDTIRYFFVVTLNGKIFPAYSPVYYFQYNLLYLVILGWAVFYCSVLKDRREKLPLRFWIITIIPPFGSTVLLTRYADEARLVMDLGVNIYLVGLLTGLFFLALNLFTFYMYVRLLAYYESHLQTKLLQWQVTAYARRVAVVETFQRQTDETRHELKNLLFGLKVDMDQQNYESVNKRIRTLLGDLKQAEPEIYTGIPLIDAIISYKLVRLRELGADLSVQADLLDAGIGPLESPAAYDIASIMGIALDNVTDACETLHRADQTSAPPVSCAIQKKPLLLLIQVTNPLPQPLSYKNGVIQSTKTQSGHGLGLSALRRIAGKYGGKVAIADTDGTFSLTVTLFM